MREGFEAEISVIAAHPALVDATEWELIFQIVRKHAIDGHATGRGSVQYFLNIGLVVAVHIQRQWFVARLDVMALLNSTPNELPRFRQERT